MKLSPLQLVIVALALDVSVLAAIVVLGLAHVIPGEAIAGLLGLLCGHRIRGAGGPGLPGAGSDARAETPRASRVSRSHIAEASSVVGLVVAVLERLEQLRHAA